MNHRQHTTDSAEVWFCAGSTRIASRERSVFTCLQRKNCTFSAHTVYQTIVTLV